MSISLQRCGRRFWLFTRFPLQHNIDCCQAIQHCSSCFTRTNRYQWSSTALDQNHWREGYLQSSQIHHFRWRFARPSGSLSGTRTYTPAVVIHTTRRKNKRRTCFIECENNPKAIIYSFLSWFNNKSPTLLIPIFWSYSFHRLGSWMRNSHFKTVVPKWTIW